LQGKEKGPGAKEEERKSAPGERKGSDGKGPRRERRLTRGSLDERHAFRDGVDQPERKTKRRLGDREALKQKKNEPRRSKAPGQGRANDNKLQIRPRYVRGFLNNTRTFSGKRE